jgi:predicted CoA-binding protein
VEDLIKGFMAQEKFVVVGATDNPEKYGHQILADLRKRGCEVYLVNPRLKTIEGMGCYATLSDIPVKVDVVDFVVPPSATEAILKEYVALGLRRVWLQPGSESEAANSFCRENNLKAVHSVYVMVN